MLKPWQDSLISLMILSTGLYISFTLHSSLAEQQALENKVVEKTGIAVAEGQKFVVNSTGCNDGDELTLHLNEETNQMEYRCYDVDPNSFNFTDKANVTLNTITVSEILPITGISSNAPVSISGSGSPQFRICSDINCNTVVQNWGNEEKTITNNQYLQVRLTPTEAVMYNTTVKVGEVSDSWVVKILGTIDYYVDCQDVYNKGNTTDGIYTIDPDGLAGEFAFDIMCDMNIGVGWTILKTEYAAYSLYGNPYCGGADVDPCKKSNIIPWSGEMLNTFNIRYKDNNNIIIPSAQINALANISNKKTLTNPSMWALDINDWSDVYTLKWTYHDGTFLIVPLETMCPMNSNNETAFTQSITPCNLEVFDSITNGKIPIKLDLIKTVNSGYWFDFSQSDFKLTR